MNEKALSRRAKTYRVGLATAFRLAASTARILASEALNYNDGLRPGYVVAMKDMERWARAQARLSR